MQEAKIKQHMDFTVSVEIGEGKFLRKMTTSSGFDLSNHPYHWSNWMIASEMFNDYTKELSRLANIEFQKKRRRDAST